MTKPVFDICTDRRYRRPEIQVPGDIAVGRRVTTHISYQIEEIRIKIVLPVYKSGEVDREGVVTDNRTGVTVLNISMEIQNPVRERYDRFIYRIFYCIDPLKQRVIVNLLALRQERDHGQEKNQEAVCA
jgi:hypothetical protein